MKHAFHLFAWAFLTTITACADSGTVPPTRKINGKPLSSNIVLVPSDLGATPTGAAIFGMSAPGNDMVMAWNGAGVLTPVTKSSLGGDVSGKANLAGGNTFAGAQVINHNATTGTPFQINLPSGYSGNVFSVVNSASAHLLGLSHGATLTVGNGITAGGAITGSNLSGTNTGDQTSIVGITGTVAQFNTALTDGDFPSAADFTASKTLHVSKATAATDTRTGLEKCDPHRPFATLTAAVAAAASGDLIRVGPGTFNTAGSITLNGVSVVGAGKDQTVFTNTLFLPTGGTVLLADFECRGGPTLRDSALLVTGGNFVGRNLHLDTRPQGGWDSAFTQGANTIARFYNCFFASDFDGVISGAGQGGTGIAYYYDCDFQLSNPAHPAQPGHVKSLYASGKVEVFGGRFLSSTNAIGGSFDVEVAEGGSAKLNGPSLLGLSPTLETLGTLTGTYTDSSGVFRTVGAVSVGGSITGSNLSGTNTGDQTTVTGNAGSATILQTGRTISITGDMAYTSGSFNGSGNVTGTGTLSTVNSNTGQFGSSTSIPQFLVDAKGRITSVSGQAVIAPAGTLTGTTLASNVTGSSITSLGNLTGLNVLGNTVLGDGTGNTITFNGRVNSNLYPSASATYDLGGSSFRWKDGYFSGDLFADVLGATSISTTGNSIFGDTNADTITLNGYVASAIIPAVTATHDLGTTSLRFRDGWFSRNVAIAGTTASSSASTGALVVSGGAAFNANTSITGNLLMLPNGSTNRTINFGAGYGASAITMYDGGAGGRWIWGLQPGMMHFIGAAGAGNAISWSSGGDLPGAGVTTNERMRLVLDTGNLLLGSPTDDATHKLQVNGGLKTAGPITEGVVAAGTVTTASTLALTTGTVVTATLTASTACTFTMPTATAGRSFSLYLKQAASTGNGTATFTGVKWSGGTAPTITATAGRMDILSFVSDGTNWYGSFVQNFTP